MEKLDTQAEKLAHIQKKICMQLNRITRLQELLHTEEEKLYYYLHQEKALNISGSADTLLSLNTLSPSSDRP